MLRINSATKNLLLVRSFGTPTPGKKSRSFARAQDDADAIFRIGDTVSQGPRRFNCGIPVQNNRSYSCLMACSLLGSNWLWSNNPLSSISTAPEERP
jgi:hypothetical protein